MKEIKPQDMETTHEWSLVLQARGIPHKIVIKGETSSILVDDEHFIGALKEIKAFELENKGWPPKSSFQRENQIQDFEATILGIFVVGSVLSLLLSDVLHGLFVSVGANESHAVFREGQWWRPITALTLHQDPAHLLSNLVMGGLFWFFLAQLIGGALAWTLALASGIVGNLLSISLKPESGGSIGASTSVFGIVGALLGLNLSNRTGGEGHYKRLLIYLGSGLALLSFLGVGDEDTDRTAHFMGFFAGLFMGMITGWQRVWLSSFFERHRLLVYGILIGVVTGAWATGLLVTHRLSQVFHLMAVLVSFY